MSQSRDQTIQALRRQAIPDENFRRMREKFPFDDKCPTCRGIGSYFDGERSGVVCDCVFQKLLYKHYLNAGIGRTYHPLNTKEFWGSDRDAAISAIEKYIRRAEDNLYFGVGATFVGPIGVGKTLTMLIIGKELIKAGYDFFNISFEELINSWGSSHKSAEEKWFVEKRLKKVQFLAIDEVRTDPRNEMGFLASGIESVIRHRVDNMLPTLMTTNMHPRELKGEFAKAFSLLSSRNETVVFTGKDIRGNIVVQDIISRRDSGERRAIC